MPEQQSFVLYIVVGSSSKSGSRLPKTAPGAVFGSLEPLLEPEAGEPILCRFWEHTASPLRRLPKPLLEARSRFLACCQGAM